MRATIVFADGSKQIAHALDDLYERWEERRIARAEDVAALYEQGIAIPEIETPSSIEEALVWRTQLLKMKDALLDQRRIVLESGNKFTQAARLRPIGLAEQVLMTRFAVIKAYVKQHNVSAQSESDREIIDALKQEVARLRARVAELEGALEGVVS